MQIPQSILDAIADQPDLGPDSVVTLTWASADDPTPFNLDGFPALRDNHVEGFRAHAGFDPATVHVVTAINDAIASPVVVGPTPS
jgi:hypothetical protein